MCTDCRTPGHPDITLACDEAHRFVFRPRSERGDTFLAGVFQDLREAGIDGDLTWTFAKEVVAWAQQQGLVVHIAGLDLYGQPLVNRLPW